MAIISEELALALIDAHVKELIVQKQRGLWVLRQRNLTVNNRRLPDQQANRTRFSEASRLAKELAPSYRANYMVLCHEINRTGRKMTPRNLFLRHLMRDVITTDPQTHDPIIHYENIQLTPDRSRFTDLLEPIE